MGLAVWATSQSSIGRKEVGRIDKKAGQEEEDVGEMSSFRLLWLLGHGAPSPLLCHPGSSSANHKEAARTPQARDAALENSRFHFDVCLRDEKS